MGMEMIGTEGIFHHFQHGEWIPSAKSVLDRFRWKRGEHNKWMKGRMERGIDHF
jgi:hypothetical protein